jgi:hypothetical protein
VLIANMKLTLHVQRPPPNIELIHIRLSEN